MNRDSEDRFRTAEAIGEGVVLVLKHDDTFGVYDRAGEIRSTGGAQGGLFHDGTRFLSAMTLEVNGAPLRLLSSAVEERGMVLVVDLTNAELAEVDGVGIAADTLHVRREMFLHKGSQQERIRVRNYGRRGCEIALSVFFQADFADIFEVRGMSRERRGNVLPVEIGSTGVVLSYRGLDDLTRYTTVRCSPAPGRVEADRVVFTAALEPQQEAVMEVAVSCGYGEVVEAEGFEGGLAARRAAAAVVDQRSASVTSTHPLFSSWIEQATTDLRMLVTDTAEGRYPYAGTPWYSTAFGRDGVITAWQVLWVEPEIAAGVLRFLAARQARGVDPEREAEPGKMLHETRSGEMAALGEIPFGLYYGSVDVTALFVMLAGEYFQHTGDRGLVEELWPQVEAALGWIDTYGDVDGDGFVEYARRGAEGLVNQGWKDSVDSVFHADGSEADGPIALCEVQAYVYAAKQAAAGLARAMGHTARADGLEHEAREQRARFNEVFWLDELATYALALDGEKRPCRVRSSNAGHCLFAGIADDARAARLAATLLSDEMFSGFGVRTIAEGEARYNPLSYHNGSVWPHDSAMIAAGLARYGFKDEALRIMSGLFAAGTFMERQRMPELFCGFSKRAGAGPTLYPVACAPQAWAAGSVFMVLGACLGLRVNGVEGSVEVDEAVLPEGIEGLEIANLRAGERVVDVRFRREDGGVEVVVMG